MLKLKCRVICVDSNQKALDDLKSYLQAEIDDYELKTVYFYNFDVTSTEQIEMCAQLIEREAASPVDILINNAGIFNKGKLLNELTEKEIRNIFDVNINQEKIRAKNS